MKLAYGYDCSKQCANDGDDSNNQYSWDDNQNAGSAFEQCAKEIFHNNIPFYRLLIKEHVSSAKKYSTTFVMLYWFDDYIEMLFAGFE